ncbi:MAG: hypothetical protein ABSB40_11290 [Nitrososphaeria archaeon]
MSNREQDHNTLWKDIATYAVWEIIVIVFFIVILSVPIIPYTYTLSEPVQMNTNISLWKDEPIFPSQNLSQVVSIPENIIIIIIIIIIFIIIIIIAYLLYRLFSIGPRERELESVILSTIRSRNGATMDDIIIGAHISSEKASQETRKLIARGVIKTVDKEGKTFYMTT